MCYGARMLDRVIRMAKLVLLAAGLSGLAFLVVVPFLPLFGVIPPLMR